MPSSLEAFSLEIWSSVVGLAERAGVKIRNEESMSCGRVETGRQQGQGRRSRREQEQGAGQGREVKQGQGRVEISAEVGSISRSGEIMAPSSYR